MCGSSPPSQLPPFSSPFQLSHLGSLLFVYPVQWHGWREAREPRKPRFLFPLPTPGMIFAVTGSLSELQISCVCREVLQVRWGRGAPKVSRALYRPKGSASPLFHVSPGSGLLALTKEDTPRHQGRLGTRATERGWKGHLGLMIV